MAINPFQDYLQAQVDQQNKQAEAVYQVALGQFSIAAAAYQANAERQYFADGSVLAPPQPPVKKTYSLSAGKIVEADWTDPNLHAPVFVVPKPVAPSGLPDISNAVTLEQVAAMLVLIKQDLDKLLAGGK